MSSPLYTNRLVREKSPYLLQHAHNPVDWYPWSPEAFNAAKEQDRPIFLSIGYSTCHWCHVMEEESFARLDVAKLMNEVCINIKVDREEMPEIDSLYMEFAQAMLSGGAGWPLNVLLTPDLMPFFAVTYLPAEGEHGVLGLKQLLLRIQEIWKHPEEREMVIHQAGKIVDVFAAHIHSTGTALPGKEKIVEAADILYKTADPIYGGTRGAPKFPIGYQGSFLLQHAKASHASRSLFYVERSLEMMHRGGIYDHLGGGFSRYSIDERWFVPHFEKMLYDNAILARVYLEAWQFTHLEFYRAVCEEILGYLLRDMASESGGFFSAEDADSEGKEGYYYTWSWQEIQQVLGGDSALFCEFFGCTPTGHFNGRNILHQLHSFEEFAAAHHLDPSLLRAKLKELKGKLFAVRSQRVRPNRDDKIITAWNGLMIYTLAEAGRAFQDERYLKAACRCATFLKEKLWQQGRLLRRFRDNEARFEGCLDDYAFLIHGLLSLVEADQGIEWLEWAVLLAEVLKQEFKAPQGAFYLTNGQDPHVILRRCEFYDGAEPSGNAIHAENLIRLHQLTGSPDYLTQAREVLQSAKEHIDLYPAGACTHLMALTRFLDAQRTTFIVSFNEKEEHKAEIVQMMGELYLPHHATLFRRESDEVLRDLSPLSRDKRPLEGKTTLYLCHPDKCLPPVTDLPLMRDAIQQTKL